MECYWLLMTNARDGSLRRAFADWLAANPGSNRKEISKAGHNLADLRFHLDRGWVVTTEPEAEKPDVDCQSTIDLLHAVGKAAASVEEAPVEEAPVEEDDCNSPQCETWLVKAVKAHAEKNRKRGWEVVLDMPDHLIADCIGSARTERGAIRKLTVVVTDAKNEALGY